MFDITFDNVNQRTNTLHFKRGKTNLQLNMAQAFATKERIGTGGMSDAMPSAEDIRGIKLESILPSENDFLELKQEMGTICMQIICSNIEEFQEVPVCLSIEHQYTRHSSRKSEMVRLNLVNKQHLKSHQL